MRALHWFRSDLRVADNAGLAAAAARAERLCGVFVLDERLLRGAACGAPRVRFLLEALAALRADLERRGSRLLVRRGDPATELVRLADETRVELVTWNRDDGPYARARDRAVEAALARAGVRVETFRDRVVFEAGEVRTKAGRPFSVYTPYRRAWLAREAREPATPIRVGPLPPPLPRVPGARIPRAAELGFAGGPRELPPASSTAALRRLDAFLERDVAAYPWQRELPARAGTSRLSPQLRFGTLSIRTVLARAREAAADDRRRRAGVAKWRDELVWREFYSALLAENPRVLRGAYRSAFDRLEWEDDDVAFRAWCEGRTGYPFVDAGMRELAATGWMHNRARMVAASFLAKQLGIDWRRGERFFMRALVDGDPANNNGGWQWSASTGSDAQPYFRIFNPTAQAARYDPDGAYAKRWLPELARGRDYPPPIVDHATARERALARYRAVLTSLASGSGRPSPPRPLTSYG